MVGAWRLIEPRGYRVSLHLVGVIIIKKHRSRRMNYQKRGARRILETYVALKSLE